LPGRASVHDSESVRALWRAWCGGDAGKFGSRAGQRHGAGVPSNPNLLGAVNEIFAAPEPKLAMAAGASAARRRLPTIF
jgi:hypothetical protein